MAMGRRLAVAAALVLLGSVAASTASAGPRSGPTNAICTIQGMEIHLNPGLSALTTSGTLNSHGPGGLLDCEGQVDGKDVTGGHITVRGTYTGTCLNNSAEGLITVRFDTIDEAEGGNGRFAADTLLTAGAFQVTFKKFGTANGALFQNFVNGNVEGDCASGVTKLEGAAGSIVFDQSAATPT